MASNIARVGGKTAEVQNAFKAEVNHWSFLYLPNSYRDQTVDASTVWQWLMHFDSDDEWGISQATFQVALHNLLNKEYLENV